MSTVQATSFSLYFLHYELVIGNVCFVLSFFEPKFLFFTTLSSSTSPPTQTLSPATSSSFFFFLLFFFLFRIFYFFFFLLFFFFFYIFFFFFPFFFFLCFCCSSSSSHHHNYHSISYQHLHHFDQFFRRLQYACISIDVIAALHENAVLIRFDWSV